MLIDFFLHVRAHHIPASTREFVTLLEGLKAGLVPYNLDDFYFFARTCLVKDESRYDKFDQAFASYFRGIESLPAMQGLIPEQWLKLAAERLLSEEQKARAQALGWERLMQEFQERLQEQKAAHAGGEKWIGSRGTSPFGHSGHHPQGIRAGGESQNRSAVKVWQAREFRNLDDEVEMGTRNIKIALRRLRKFAREGATEELDLDGTIHGTARNAGWLDVQMRPERHNKVKVLLFLDIGGSMDDHVQACQELFSACKSEFKQLEYFYFHNCVYDFVWKDNRRRQQQQVLLWDILHKYGPDYKLIFVGDASMSPFEITHAGGSLEYHNNEAGQVWLKRLLQHFSAAAWLNPANEQYWPYRQSTSIIADLLQQRMYPLTLRGLDIAMKALVR